MNPTLLPTGYRPPLGYARLGGKLSPTDGAANAALIGSALAADRKVMLDKPGTYPINLTGRTTVGTDGLGGGQFLRRGWETTRDRVTLEGTDGVVLKLADNQLFNTTANSGPGTLFNIVDPLFVTIQGIRLAGNPTNQPNWTGAYFTEASPYRSDQSMNGFRVFSTTRAIEQFICRDCIFDGFFGYAAAVEGKYGSNTNYSAFGEYRDNRVIKCGEGLHMSRFWDQNCINTKVIESAATTKGDMLEICHTPGTSRIIGGYQFCEGDAALGGGGFIDTGGSYHTVIEDIDCSRNVCAFDATNNYEVMKSLIARRVKARATSQAAIQLVATNCIYDLEDITLIDCTSGIYSGTSTAGNAGMLLRKFTAIGTGQAIDARGGTRITGSDWKMINCSNAIQCQVTNSGAFNGLIVIIGRGVDITGGANGILVVGGSPNVQLRNATVDVGGSASLAISGGSLSTVNITTAG